MSCSRRESGEVAGGLGVGSSGDVVLICNDGFGVAGVEACRWGLVVVGEAGEGGWFCRLNR